MFTGVPCDAAKRFNINIPPDRGTSRYITYPSFEASATGGTVAGVVFYNGSFCYHPQSDRGCEKKTGSAGGAI